MLTKSQEATLIKKAQSGDEKSRNKLIEYNYKLVCYVARKYSSDIPLEDLIQEGTLGLFDAIKNFNPNLQYKFSTYATFWIKRYINRAVDTKYKLIYIPTWISESLQKIKKAKKLLENRYNRNPTDEEICDEVGVTLHKYNEIIQATNSVIFLSDDTEYESYSYVAKDNRNNPGKEEQDSYLTFLSEIEKEVILQKLNKNGGLSKNVIKMIENTAVKKIANAAREVRQKKLIK